MKIFISIVLILLSTFTIFAQTQAEVIVPTTFLRKSPNSNAEKVHEVKQGQKINLENGQADKGWYYVSIGDGKVKGWINGNAIRTTTTAIQNPSNEQTSTPAVTSSDTPATEDSEPIEDNEVLRIDTEEVNINVRVFDGNNRPVNNLKEAHFQVYEDNVLQPITYLATAEVPAINALVIDNSRSLRSQLEKVIEAGKIIVGTTGAKDESTVVRFVSADKIEVVQNFTPNKNLLNQALDNLFVEGGQTAIIDAIYLTAKRLEEYHNSQKDDTKRKTLIVVSDGEDRSSTYKEQQLFELLRQSDVQIYVIGFVNNLSNQKETDEPQSRQEKAKAFLNRLAQETGGKVYFPSSINELPQIANDIASELQTQYLISYAPTNEKRDGTFRNIKVVVADGANKEKRTAITRTGRTSAPVEKKSTTALPNQKP